MIFDDKAVLVTGGTGSFGRKFVSHLLEHARPRKVVVFSRDELKQYEMANLPEFNPANRPEIQYFIGDVRDIERLRTAFRGIDFIVHAAALKQVPACEYNPFEAIKTNVLGAQNIITAAIECNVQRVVALSTDKAAAPVNLYGATKLCSDKLFVAGNIMSGTAPTRFAVVRYGNVVGSRGSVFPFFLKQAREKGRLSVTDPRMTRFSITLGEGVRFVMDSFRRMRGGEVFVPKIPSYRILDVAEAIGPGLPVDIVGIRPGEKLHEAMITADDARNTVELADRYVIQPEFNWWDASFVSEGTPCPDDFSYVSGTNDRWLTVEELRTLCQQECAL
ncbi:UDP-N-acetylglucosamine 4,6-dehydratase (inverting) [Phaeovibrio sulfidiphilus]|uniref:UDP-N-acetylglucosamine 4,6-dehydratase (Inverting) n=1 Tax=Phaeovibrio sulfidiphilus TaxID=1220600 RepID=A0A8J7CDW3_9PROT|nr:UDP-N-acetylglucosamine 4,6-dehydratase (inverting) [Phaeovibrio sulfidiphilus]MBE1237324.1 UDP-N-acetylglucosamine 4,6-dehydratase (inverting) [Phaeovibrio sulfidiphilus]